MKNIEDIIYDLIFSDNIEYKIDLSEYIVDIYKYDKFIANIKKILKKSKVSILNEKVNLGSTSVIWEIKVKK